MLFIEEGNKLLWDTYIYIYISWEKPLWYIYISVGSWFMVQAQIIWGLGPMSPIQWICREWVKELGPNELDNG